MDFFSELYHGDIYPEEEIAVHIATDPKYKELSSNLSQVAAQLTNQDENIQQLVKQYSIDCFKNIGYTVNNGKTAERMLISYERRRENDQYYGRTIIRG